MGLRFDCMILRDLELEARREDRGHVADAMVHGAKPSGLLELREEPEEREVGEQRAGQLVGGRVLAVKMMRRR